MVGGAGQICFYFEYLITVFASGGIYFRFTGIPEHPSLLNHDSKGLCLFPVAGGITALLGPLYVLLNSMKMS